MTLPRKDQLMLFTVFYKSTLTLSVTSSVLIAVINFNDFLFTFGFGFFSIGTVMSLFYKEISHSREYYFYYNKGISKTWLLTGCAAGNFFWGISIILIAHYVRHP